LEWTVFRDKHIKLAKNFDISKSIPKYLFENKDFTNPAVFLTSNTSFMNFLPILAFSFLTIGACNSISSSKDQETQTSGISQSAPLIGFAIVKTYPHDPSFFTEGLEFYNESLLESSGGDNDNSPYPSAMGVLDLNKGLVTKKAELDRSKYFGEGITIFNQKIYMLTWKGGIGFIFDSKTYKQLGNFNIPTKEGWGLTHDTTSLIMSDGSNNIYFLNPETLQIKYTLSVNDNGEPIGNINELEYVNGFIYANRWQTPYIFKIDAKSGSVVGKIDLTNIDNQIAAKGEDTHEMNGIAFKKETSTLFVTGKKWPLIYELKLQ